MRAARQARFTASENGHANGVATTTRLELPVDQLIASPTNPRKHFQEAPLAELSASILSLGVLEPLIVRPAPGFELVPGKDGKKPGWFWENRTWKILFGFSTDQAEAKKQPPYEIVAGERRFRAAKLAGLKTVPCDVRAFSDLQVLEVQLVENLQRQDLDPFEEAAGYQALLDQHGYDVDGLAAKLAKSPSWVRGSLKLLNLDEPARKSLAAGELSKSVAQLLARIGSQKARLEATKLALNKDWADRLPSFRTVKEEIERRWMRELKGACFDRKSLELVPAAGTCDACPKRTGNNREDYPDARADVCTDPVCFDQKVQAHGLLQLGKARAAGKSVLPAAEATKLFNSTGLAYNSGYVDLGSHCYQDRKGRTYAEILGKKGADEAAVLAVDAKGNVHTLAKESQVKRVLKEKGIGDHHHRGSARQLAETAKARLKRELEARVMQGIRDEIYRKTSAMLAPASDKLLKELEPMLRLLLADELEMGSPSDEEVNGLRWTIGLPPLATDGQSARRNAPKSNDELLQQPAERLFGLWFAARFGQSYYYGGGQAELLGVMKIDRDEVRRKLEAEEAKVNGKPNPMASPDRGRKQAKKVAELVEAGAQT